MSEYQLENQIAGWRRFKICTPVLGVEPYELVGAWNRHPWRKDGPMKAECKPIGQPLNPCRGGPLRQNPSCKCGLHIYYEYERARDYTQTKGTNGFVIACAAGTGRVLFDEKHARCEYAKVLSIIDPREYPQTDPYSRLRPPPDITDKVCDWAANTADAYGVPVLSPTDAMLDAIAQGFVFIDGITDTLDGKEIVRGLDDFEEIDYGET